jgi:hypothetical protein
MNLKTMADKDNAVPGRVATVPLDLAIGYYKTTCRSALGNVVGGALRTLCLTARWPSTDGPLLPRRCMSPPAVHDEAQSYANPSFRAMAGRLGSRAPLVLNCVGERLMAILQV